MFGEKPFDRISLPRKVIRLNFVSMMSHSIKCFDEKSVTEDQFNELYDDYKLSVTNVSFFLSLLIYILAKLKRKKSTDIHKVFNFQIFKDNVF